VAHGPGADVADGPSRREVGGHFIALSDDFNAKLSMQLVVAICSPMMRSSLSRIGPKGLISPSSFWHSP
jgi:hypothetical protein